MSKTHFSGPVYVGTNSNNQGIVVSAVSDVYDVATDGEGTAGDYGTLKSPTSLVIPNNSQIVDINLNVETGFNNYVSKVLTFRNTDPITDIEGGGDLTGIRVGASTGATGDPPLPASALVLSTTAGTPNKITLNANATGAATGQTVTFSSGKYLNLGTGTSGAGLTNLLNKRGLLFDSTAGTPPDGIIFPRGAAGTTGWVDVGSSLGPSRMIRMGFVDDAATKSTAGSVRVTIFYAQGVDIG